jgi:hypothetical protein
MEDQGITPEQLDAVLTKDYETLKQRICDAMNAAKGGRIIADTEEPVRDAHAAFRQEAYQKAIDLLAQSVSQEAFSPSAQRGKRPMEE